MRFIVITLTMIMALFDELLPDSSAPLNETDRAKLCPKSPQDSPSEKHELAAVLKDL